MFVRIVSWYASVPARRRWVKLCALCAPCAAMLLSGSGCTAVSGEYPLDRSSGPTSLDAVRSALIIPPDLALRPPSSDGRKTDAEQRKTESPVLRDASAPPASTASTASTSTARVDAAVDRLLGRERKRTPDNQASSSTDDASLSSIVGRLTGTGTGTGISNGVTVSERAEPDHAMPAEPSTLRGRDGLSPLERVLLRNFGGDQIDTTAQDKLQRLPLDASEPTDLTERLLYYRKTDPSEPVRQRVLPGVRGKPRSSLVPDSAATGARHL